MSENELMQEDEISLFDLWDKLRAGWRYVAGGTAIGLLGAGLAVVVISPNYQATSVIQIGQVAGTVVEAASTTMERFKAPAFLLEVAHAAKNQKLIDAISASGELTKTIKAQLVKGTALIEITTLGESPQAAKELNQHVLDALVDRHQLLGGPMLTTIQNNIKILKEKSTFAEAELADVTRISNGVVPKDGQFSQLSLMTSLRLQKQSELFSLRQALIAAELSLTSASTMPTKSIEAVFVAERAVSPKKGLLLALGLIGGLLGGIVAVFVADGWRRSRASRGR